MNTRISWQIRLLGVTLFVGVVLFLLLGISTAANSIGSRAKSNDNLARINDLSRSTLEIKALASDLNGWQTAYAFDIVRNVKGALLDSSPARVGFLNAEALLEEQLVLLKARNAVLDAFEQTKLTEALQNFEDFKLLDLKIMTLFRSNNPKLMQQALDLALGSETQISQTLNQQVGKLSDSIVNRAERENQRLQNTEQVLFSRFIWFYGVALAGILVFSVIFWYFSQQRSKLLRQLEQLATTDSLTNLTNRRAWNEQFPQCMARASRNQQPLSIAMIDLDYFKNFNDTHGHLAGDALLREMGSVLRSSLRVNDLVARYGGEEFVVAFENCNLEQAQSLLERLQSRIPQGQTISVGLAATDGTETPEIVLDRADKAMYQAKQNGRNRVQISAKNRTLKLEPGF